MSGPIFRWFDKVASVYPADPTDFQVAVKTDLVCGLFHLNTSSPSTGVERTELQADRRLMWDPAYEIPEGAQVEIDGERWQTVIGTFQHHSRNNTPNAYRRCDVLRVS